MMIECCQTKSTNAHALVDAQHRARQLLVRLERGQVVLPRGLDRHLGMRPLRWADRGARHHHDVEGQGVAAASWAAAGGGRSEGRRERAAEGGGGLYQQQRQQDGENQEPQTG